MVVYIDLLFLVNLLLNSFALWLTARFSGQSPKLCSLLSASSVGAVYGLGVATPWAEFCAHPCCKLLLAFLLVRIAFRAQRLIACIRLTGVFLLASFVTAGCVLGLQSLLLGERLRGRVLSYGQLPGWVLLLALLLVALLGRHAIDHIEHNLVHVANRASISFCLEGHQVVLAGLVDSGNQLQSPFGGRPVVVVPLETVADYLPPEMVAMAASDLALDQRMDGLAEHPWATRVRFIPYRSVGMKAGILPGWRLDQAVVTTGHGSRTSLNVVLAVASHQLSGQNAFQALIPERLLPQSNTRMQEVLE